MTFTTTAPLTWTVGPKTREMQVSVRLKVIERDEEQDTIWADRRVLIPIDRIAAFDLNAEIMAMVEDVINLTEEK